MFSALQLYVHQHVYRPGFYSDPPVQTCEDPECIECLNKNIDELESSTQQLKEKLETLFDILRVRVVLSFFWGVSYMGVIWVFSNNWKLGTFAENAVSWGAFLGLMWLFGTIITYFLSFCFPSKLLNMPPLVSNGVLTNPLGGALHLRVQRPPAVPEP